MDLLCHPLQQELCQSIELMKARLMATARNQIANPEGTPASIFNRGAGVLDTFAAVNCTGRIVEARAGSPIVERDPHQAGLLRITTEPYQRAMA